MLGTIVTFQFDDDFDETNLRKLAQLSRAKFENLADLRTKTFTINSAKRQAINFYVWNSEAAARAFFTEEALNGVTKVYGVRPTVEFVEIATVVDNEVKSDVEL